VCAQRAYAYEPVTLEDVERAAQVDKKFADFGQPRAA
jgi:hypothetical protein